MEFLSVERLDPHRPSIIPIFEPEMRAKRTDLSQLMPIVAIPVRDEADRIEPLIHALGRQSWLDNGAHVLPLVLVFNACTDDSARIAAAAAERYPQLQLHPVVVDFPPACAHVGSARRLGLDLARTLSLRPQDTVLLTTDADARPAARWVEANLAAIAGGADVVGGQIVGDREEEAALGPRFLARAAAHERYSALCDEVAARIDPVAWDPWPRHRHHTGASLAFTAEAFDRIGGLPALPTREDLAIVSRFRAGGFRLRHDPAVVVEVSARTVGRALGGMADCLRNWVDMANADQPLLVEAPASVIARARLRSWLRSPGPNGVVGDQDLASLLDIPAGEWRTRRGDGNFRAFLVERFAPDEPDAPASVPVEEAIAELTACLASLEAIGHAA